MGRVQEHPGRGRRRRLVLLRPARQPRRLQRPILRLLPGQLRPGPGDRRDAGLLDPDIHLRQIPLPGGQLRRQFRRPIQHLLTLRRLRRARCN
ncbi:MAG: hypothetical protein M0C28_03795 [Candidatus Moduliflexus flocculans]|nr:hypothetical protein [Candidatus Moduliflexus flocculans]